MAESLWRILVCTRRSPINFECSRGNAAWLWCVFACIYILPGLCFDTAVREKVTQWAVFSVPQRAVCRTSLVARNVIHSSRRAQWHKQSHKHSNVPRVYVKYSTVLCWCTSARITVFCTIARDFCSYCTYLNFNFILRGFRNMTNRSTMNIDSVVPLPLISHVFTNINCYRVSDKLLCVRIAVVIQLLQINEHFSTKIRLRLQ